MSELTSALGRRAARIARQIPRSLLESLCARLEQADACDKAALVKLTTAGIALSVRQDMARVAENAWDAGLSARALGVVFRAALENDEWWRAHRKLRVVWTGPDNPKDTMGKTEQALLRVILHAKSELWIVSFVAFAVKSVVTALLATPPGVRVNFLLDNADENAALQYDGIDYLSNALGDRATFYIWPRENRPVDKKGNVASLHAKCAVADGSWLLITSANLTEAALERNMELGVVIEGGPEPREVLDHLHWLVQNDQVRRLEVEMRALS